MGLSETIIAAMIGASATLSAAGFQLMKARAPASAKPRRSALRAALTLVALVVASAVGGYAYSELRAQGAREEIARLRTEMNGQMQALLVASERQAAPQPQATEPAWSEALVRLPPCTRSGSESDGPAPLCEPASIAPVTLCTQIPASARPLGIERYSRPADGDNAWRAYPAEGDTGALDVSFTDAAPALAASADLVPVCVTVRSEDPARSQIARLVVRYRHRTAADQSAVALR